MSGTEREAFERELQERYPKDGRLIRIKPTAETERMGIAGWEGVKQGTVSPYCWYFARSESRLGDPKVGIPWDIPWWYVEDG